jgi:phosphoserine phosphatase RsbU/P
MPEKLPSWIEHDLMKARAMLERFTPVPLPKSTGVDCGAACQQLFQIGGDYYDFFVQSATSSVIAIGDVSGKGISAALMLANLRAALHDEMLRDTINLAGLISKLNRLVYEASPEESYITFFYAQYDQETSKLHYVNAGHNPPLLFQSLSRDGTPRELTVGGFPLGLFRDPPQPFQQGTESLRPGDIIVAYTDGVTDITDRSNSEWGLERLVDSIRSNQPLPAQQLVDTVLRQARTYGYGDANDDMTLIVLKGLKR